MLVLRQTPKDHYLDSIIVVFMLFLRIQDENLLRDFVLGHVQAGDLIQQFQRVKPRGQAFYDSEEGILIEAHLLYAHYRRCDYVEDILKKYAELNNEQLNDTKNKRMKEIVSKFYYIREHHYDRDGFDLDLIDRRINLVATGLKEN